MILYSGEAEPLKRNRRVPCCLSGRIQAEWKCMFRRSPVQFRFIGDHMRRCRQFVPGLMCVNQRSSVFEDPVNTSTHFSETWLCCRHFAGFYSKISSFVKTLSRRGRSEKETMGCVICELASTKGIKASVKKSEVRESRGVEMRVCFTHTVTS